MLKLSPEFQLSILKNQNYLKMVYNRGVQNVARHNIESDTRALVIFHKRATMQFKILLHILLLQYSTNKISLWFSQFLHVYPDSTNTCEIPARPETTFASATN